MGRIYGANGGMALMEIAERNWGQSKRDAKPKVRKMRETNIQANVGMVADRKLNKLK